MTASTLSRLSVPEFYDWLSTQTQGKYELVDGAVMMLEGAGRRHDRIVVNALRAFGNRLVGHSCQPFTSNTYIRVPNGNLRHADVGVECGHSPDHSMEADCPFVVMKILSPTTWAFDLNEKLEEYRTVETLGYLLLVDPDSPQVRLYVRDRASAWTSKRLEGRDAAIEFENLPVRLLLSELYDGLEFRPRPMLVDPEAQSRLGI